MRHPAVLLIGLLLAGCGATRTTDHVYAFQPPVAGRDGRPLAVADVDWAACDRTADRVAAYYGRVAGQEGAILGTLLLGLLGGLAVGAGGGQFEATQEVALVRRPAPAAPAASGPEPEARRRAREEDYEAAMRRCLRGRGYAIDAPADRRGFPP